MPEYDRARFEALVLFIAWRTKDDPHFGRLKVAKTLCYSDFDVYLDTGEPLTGATYIRLPQGPFPAQLEEAEIHLRDLGLVKLDYDKDEYEEKRIIPVRAPKLARLPRPIESWQLEVVVSWIEQIGKQTARQVSDTSHDLAGWKLAAKTGEEIPYSAALLPRQKPSGQDAKAAIELGRKEGWLTDDGWVWEREATEG